MANTTNQDMLKAARKHFKKHKKNYIIGLVAYGVLMILVLGFGIGASDSSNNEAEVCMVDRIRTCEKYEEDQRERCESYLENGKEADFNDKGSSGKTCSDLGFEWVDKEKEEEKRVEAEKAQCEAEGKRWWDKYVGCVTQEEGADRDRRSEEAFATLRAEQNALDDARRKCTVMEASDINRTGGNRSTLFETAKTTCDTMYSSVYQSDRELFISDVTIDWSSRKSERIDGNDLTYHLNNLGW